MKLCKASLFLFLLAMVPAISAQPFHGPPPAGFTGSKSITLFVSATDGNDSWSGRFSHPTHDGTDGPLATLDQARKTVRTIDKSGLSEVDVVFRGGTYSLPGTVHFSQADSGSADTEIVYQNFPGESPVFSGGMRVSGWVNIGGNRWQASLPAGTVNFENLYYNGVRRLRPRVGGALGTYFRTFKTVYVDSEQDPGCPHPDTDSSSPHFNQFECFDRFEYDPVAGDNNNPYADPWTNLVPAPGNLCGQTVGDQALWGDVEILVFEQFSTSKLRVSCVDAAKNTVYLTGPTAAPPLPHATETGFIEGDRYLVENVKNALTEPGQWYLDPTATVGSPAGTLTYLAQPGEDPNRDEVVVPQLPQLLVASSLSYVTFRGLTFEHDNYTVPALGHVSVELEPEIAAAVSFQNSSYITFDSNTVREIAGTGLDFISCVTGTGPANAPAAECADPRKSPVIANNVIANSAFYDIGALGVRIGEPYLSTDNDDDVPQWTTVENNVVEGYGRTVPASFGIGQGYGHDNTYIHNDVYDGYHCAISLSENAGDTNRPNGVGVANNTISFNHVYNLLQGIMNDGGSIRVDAGNGAYTAPGNRVLNNKIHDVNDSSIMDSNGYGGHGVYMDNQTGLVDVENNLVYRVSGSAVYTPHGPSLKPGNPDEANLIKNNILAYARLGMVEEGDPFTSANPVPTQASQVVKSFVLTNNIFYFDRNLASTSPFQGVAINAPFNIPTGCAYTPFAYDLYQEFDNNLYWRTDGMFAGDADGFNVQTTAQPGVNGPCAGSRIAHAGFYTFYDFASWRDTVGEDQHSVVQNPYFANPVYPTDDYSLRGARLGIEFVPFDPNDAGRYPNGPRIEPPAVAATFATATYNPATDF